MKLNAKILFIAVVSFISIGIMLIMNLSYDSLARYPYEDERARELIKSNLEKSEIEYIVEYQINPSTFIKYIEADSFNIYHIDDYSSLTANLYYLSDHEVVEFTEQVYGKDSIESIKSYADEYYYSDLLYWYTYGDDYNPSALLIDNPNSVLAYVDDNYTISNRSPYNLVSVDYLESADPESEVLVKSIISDDLKSMCEAISEDLRDSDCGGLYAEKSYVSYNEQKKIFDSMFKEMGSAAIMYADYPGHSENQLGLAIDFTVMDEKNFRDSRQYEWLSENAYKYGFVQTYKNEFTLITNKEERPAHFRYVGLELANEMAENNKSLSEVLN